MSLKPSQSPQHSKTTFLGLAPFLRQSIAGVDLRPLGQQLLERAALDPEDAALWMNLSLAMQCLAQRELGLEFQNQALEIQRIYRLDATEQPARLRVLMLMAPGDIAANTPLECLLETGDIDLIQYYLTPGDPLAVPVPEHDVVVAALAESDENRGLLQGLEQALARWAKPVVNAPQHIPLTDRHVASEVLQHVEGLVIPLTMHAPRALLEKIAAGDDCLADCFADCSFPVIVRPIDSQAGRDLDKLDAPADLAAYLGRVTGKEFFVARFVDYRSADGLFRKYRIVLIDGVPYASHMGVSSHWMVHYVNAGMYEEACKREEEADFMANFARFAGRHEAALAEIYQRIPLDYVCIDCAETRDGELLVFEIDHCMVVHAMDPVEMFPYKQVHMKKVKTAFEDYLLRRHKASRWNYRIA